MGYASLGFHRSPYALNGARMGKAIYNKANGGGAQVPTTRARLGSSWSRALLDLLYICCGLHRPALRCVLALVLMGYVVVSS